MSNFYSLTWIYIEYLFQPYIRYRAKLQNVKSVCFTCVFLATWISLTSIVLCELLGLEKLTNAFGLLCMSRGIAAMIGSPIAGTFTASCQVCFYFVTVLRDVWARAWVEHSFGSTRCVPETHWPCADGAALPLERLARRFTVEHLVSTDRHGTGVDRGLAWEYVMWGTMY
jgi:hypothetical protein